MEYVAIDDAFPSAPHYAGEAHAGEAGQYDPATVSLPPGGDQGYAPQGGAQAYAPPPPAHAPPVYSPPAAGYPPASHGFPSAVHAVHAGHAGHAGHAVQAPPAVVYEVPAAPAPHPGVSGYFSLLGSRRRDVQKLLVLALMVTLGISLHWVAVRYWDAWLEAGVLTGRQEFLMRAAYPAAVLFALWNVKAFGLARAD